MRIFLEEITQTFLYYKRCSKTSSRLLFPWLAFAIKGLEECWLAQCQFNVTWWGIVFICRMLYLYTGYIKNRSESGPVTADLTTNVVHTFSFKLLINDIKPVRSLTLNDR